VLDHQYNDAVSFLNNKKHLITISIPREEIEQLKLQAVAKTNKSVNNFFNLCFHWHYCLNFNVVYSVVKPLTSLMVTLRLLKYIIKPNKLLHSDPNSTSLLCYSRYRSILAQQAG